MSKEVKPSVRTRMARTKGFVRLAEKMAFAIVEDLARDILRKHKNLSGFMMAMGEAFFTAPEYSNDLSLDSRAYFNRLRLFIEEWDETLHMTGNPLWLQVRDNKIVKSTNW